MGSIAALMVAELGAILYVARLGDPKSAVTPLARPWREFAMLYLLGIIGLLSVGSFLALRTALKNPTAVLSATSQVIVIVAVMAGITALIFAPIWRYARELRTIWALLICSCFAVGPWFWRWVSAQQLEGHPCSSERHPSFPIPRQQ